MSPPDPEQPRPSVAGAALGLLLVTALWAAALSASLVWLNELSAVSFLSLWGWIGATYLPLLAAGSLVALAVRRLSHAPGGVSGGVAVGALGALIVLVALNALLRWGAAYRAVANEGAVLVPMGAIDLLAVAVAGLLALAALARGARGGALAVVALVLLAATHVGNVVYERPTPALAPEVASASCEPAGGSAEGLVLLAIDGMTWTVAGPMMERGELPELAGLLDRAAYGPLDPGFPSYSPVVWATLVTGLPREQHGVHGFLRLRVPGVDRPLARGPLLNSFIWWGGLNRLLSLLSRTPLGWAAFEPLPSTDRHGHALWDVAAAHGHRVGIYDWMNTWPIEPVDGYMVAYAPGVPLSDRAAPDVAAQMESVEPEPFDGPPSIASYHRSFAQAHALFVDRQPTVSFHFNKVVDNAHDRWAGGSYWAPPVDPAEALPEDVAASYRLVDHWLGRFRRATPPGWILAVVSDHGYEFDGTGHVFSPDGVLILSGGPFACGQRIVRAHMRDVAPTLLAALGLPGSDAMQGSVLPDAWSSGRAPALARVTAYPEAWRRAPGGAEDQNGDWQELQERLRALGYAN